MYIHLVSIQEKTLLLRKIAFHLSTVDKKRKSQVNLIDTINLYIKIAISGFCLKVSLTNMNINFDKIFSYFGLLSVLL